MILGVPGSCPGLRDRVGSIVTETALRSDDHGHGRFVEGSPGMTRRNDAYILDQCSSRSSRMATLLQDNQATDQWISLKKSCWVEWSR